MKKDQELMGVLQQLKAQDIQSANVAPLSIEIRDVVDLSFNSNLYFMALKSLNEIFVTHYKNEYNDSNSNKELLKITYLSQIHLTRLLFNATIHPEHINYSCYELGILYLALINIAKSHRFHNLALSLTQIHKSIFLNKSQSSLIKSHSTSFQSWYQNEIDLYQDQFLLHFNNTSAGKITFITNIDFDIKNFHACKIMDTYKNPKYDFYQKQLAFKLIEYLYLDSIFVEFRTRKIITELMAYLNSDASEDDKQKKFESSVKAYKDILLEELKNRLITSSRETILDLSLCDYRDLVLDFVSFTSISFVNFDKHTRLPNEFRFCIFKDITFNEQMFKNTEFYDCIFINCFFNKLNISCNFYACKFEKCNLTDIKIRFSDLSECTLFQCDINNLQFYKVTAVGTKIKSLTLQNTAIIFSDIRNCIFNDVKFHTVSFEGSFFNIFTRFTNCSIRRRGSDNTLEASLQGAIMLRSIGDNEYLLDDIQQIYESQIDDEDFYNPLIITTEHLGVQLLRYTQPEFINNSLLDSNIRLITLLGWILCAVERLKEYCEDFENNYAIRTFDTFAVFEIVAVHVKTAMTHLNRFLSLYDQCHLSLMNQLLKNSLFKNFQQYQQKTNFRPELYPQLDNIHLKETLFAIHELHQSIKYIDKTFALIRNKIEENNNHQINMQFRKKK